MTKVYVIATGSAFALLALAHVARVLVEGTGPLDDAMFIASTLISLALCVWAVVVFRQLPR